jgi:hypothetical protein
MEQTLIEADENEIIIQENLREDWTEEPWNLEDHLYEQRRDTQTS